MNKAPLVLLALLTPVLAFGAIEQTVEKSFQVEAAGTLHLNACKGMIEVTPSKGTTVTLALKEKIDVSSQQEADELLSNYEFAFEPTGKDVQITAKQKKNFNSGFFSGGKHNKVQLSWILTVPETYNLNLNTAGGSIRVGDLTGQVKANTSGGPINIGHITGEVDADTSGGSIHLVSATGKVRLDTSGGPIHADLLKGPSVLDTSGGSITVKQAEDTLKADTSGGPIDVTISGPIKGNCVLDTSGGSITFHADANAAFDLLADTSGGRVTCEHPIVIHGKAESTHLEGPVNGGGPKVTLDTSGGSIHVVKNK